MNKKGITPVIAIVLLLMLAVASVGIVSYWLSSTQRQAQTGMSEQIERQTEQMAAAIEIDNIWKVIRQINIIIYTIKL